MILISLHFKSIKQEHTVEYPCILALKLVLCMLFSLWQATCQMSRTHFEVIFSTRKSFKM